MNSESPVIDYTAPDDGHSKQKWQQLTWVRILAVAALLLYLLGFFDTFFVKYGLPFNMHNCYESWLGQHYCDGPLSNSKPPAGFVVIE